MRHIVITGGSSGIGAALARGYLIRGDHVTIIARNLANLERFQQICVSQTGRAPDIVSCDVADAAGVSAALARADLNRPVDILVANAGMGGRDVLAPSTGEAQPLARQIHDVNAIGVINTVTPLLEAMTNRRRGHIVIMSSIAAFVALPQSPVYSASKAAVHSYGHGLRRLLKAHGVQVTVACPGFVDTPMSRSLPFARPFLIDAERAAAIIMRAIERGQADIIFPWPVRLAAALFSVCPTRLTDRLIVAASAHLTVDPS